MASGKTHTKIAFIGAGVAASVGIYLDQAEIGAYVATGVIIGDLFLSPDLDGVASDAKSRWSYLGFLWYWYESFKHRSYWTHGPIIADAIRNAYILFMIGLSLAVLVSISKLDPLAGPLTVFGWINKATTLNPHLCLAFFAGQCINTTLHTTADIITSETKKVIDRKPKRKPTARPARREMRKAA